MGKYSLELKDIPQGVAFIVHRKKCFYRSLITYLVFRPGSESGIKYYIHRCRVLYGNKFTVIDNRHIKIYRTENKQVH